MTVEWKPLTADSGQQVWVNPAQIQYLEAATGGTTRLHFAGERSIMVKGEPHEVVKLLFVR